MRMLRMVMCSLVAGVGMLGAGSVASAGGLVGFYVYQDVDGRGLLISSFIPGSSADALRMQGQLFSGDMITRYDGQRVFCAAQVREISRRAIGGQPLVMEFLTPAGQPFWHYVVPGGGGAAAAAPVMEFRRGSSRPGSGIAPPQQHHPGPGRPGGPGRPHGPGRPFGPGRP